MSASVLGCATSPARGTLMTSVCTGALAYADAGLLDGRGATTHWSALEDLATLGRDIDVRPDQRFVDSGDVITASGVSAGIDRALYLVARLHSEERAREVRRHIQYDPSPRYDARPETPRVSARRHRETSNPRPQRDAGHRA
jgi:transcriptional regulator GlxA family with amidase domain